MITNFRLQVVLRVIGLALVMAGTAYAVSRPQWYVTTAAGIILILILLAELVWFVEKTNRDLTRFFFSLRSGEYAYRPGMKTSGRTFTELYRSMDEVARQMEEVRASREVQYLYLQTVIDHVKVAMLCFREDGQVELSNRAARELFSITRIRSLDDLSRKDAALTGRLRILQPGKRELLVYISPAGPLRLSAAAALFTLRGESFRLVSLQDIRDELEQQELDAWQKLIRVLTHEIMNSVTPVSSLSTALNEMLRGPDGQPRPLESLDMDDAEDLYEGLQAISERSRGLLGFVGAYKNLTRLPEPSLSEVPVGKLLESTCRLMKPQFGQAGVKLETVLPARDLILQADPEMIGRVLINLLQNALDALEGTENGVVRVTALTGEDGNPVIEVRDNGPGIPPDVLEKIFIPFFTTKKQGSGIGLSQARQIMRLHRGTLSVCSTGGEGTCLVMRF